MTAHPSTLDTLAPPPTDPSLDDTRAPTPSDPSLDDTRAPMPSGLDDTHASGGPASGPAHKKGDRLQRGDALGRYVIVDFLGAGGMGAVYSAYDADLDRKVAIKVMLDEDRLDAQERVRLAREAQALAKLQHPNVVAVHELGRHAGRTFVAMEFVRGTTLAKWLAERRRTPWEIVAVFAAAGRGLAAAHAADIVHRDFKPDNVMLTPSGDDGELRVRVMDFGLARATADATVPTAASASNSALSLELTSRGALMGTPAYMAPEQYAAGDVDARTDQFSFCVALFEAFVGKRPFVGRTLPELATAVLKGEPRSFDAPRVPARWRRAVLRGLATQPQQRFATMAELLAELESDPRRRRRWTIGLAAAVLTVVAIVGGQRIVRARALAACDDEAAQIDASWNATRSADVRAALVGTGLGYAGTAANQVDALVGAWVDEWRARRRASCVGLHVDHTVTDTDHLAVAACLDEHRVELDVVVDALAHADASLVEGAGRMVDKLSPIAACDDPSWIAQRDASRPEVLALHRELSRAGSLMWLGEYQSADALARDVLARALALDDRKLQARALVHTGHAAELLDDFATAKRELEAAELAAGGAGVDDLAASAARLLTNLAFRMGEWDVGLRWGERATMWLDRLDAPAADVRRADLLNHLGNLHLGMGDVEQAGEHYRRVLEIRTAALGPDHPDVAAALNNLGGYAYSRGEFDLAAEYSERALASMRTSMGDDHPMVANTLTNLGAINTQRGRSDEAIAQLRESLALREAAFGPDHLDVAHSLHNLGLALTKRGELGEARVVLERALAIRQRDLPADHPHLAMTREALAKLPPP
ncbi:MAG TPA: serine/threonine-protein kinase [Nannocystaceae bacterium]|nr:serine/threonine-protein kinase [Nannocystaceae bacterium]